MNVETTLCASWETNILKGRETVTSEHGLMDFTYFCWCKILHEILLYKCIQTLLFGNRGYKDDFVLGMARLAHIHAKIVTKNKEFNKEYI